MVSDLKMVNKERNAGGAEFGFSNQITFQNPDDAVYIVNAIASYSSAVPQISATFSWKAAERY